MPTKSTCSRSASDRQPVAAQPSHLHSFDDYTTTGGQRALSVRVDIRDVARVYAEDPRLAGSYEDDWASDARSPYIRRAVHNAGEAIDALADFQFPANLKRDAQRAARHLTHVFQDVAQLKVVNDLTAGRLDRRKFTRLARDIAADSYDPERVRPYRRTLPTPARKPRLSIVASGAWAQMWQDPTYIPRVATLTLALTWACQAADLDPFAHLVMGHVPYRLMQSGYREAVLGVTLSAPGQTVSPRVLGVALHRNLWRCGYIALGAANYDGLKRLMDLRGAPLNRDSAGIAFPCTDGGHAVRWAESVLEADLVIAVGNVLDRERANIQLGDRFTLDEAVQAVAQQASKLKQ